jgi:hypothetical protein
MSRICGNGRLEHLIHRLNQGNNKVKYRCRDEADHNGTCSIIMSTRPTSADMIATNATVLSMEATSPKGDAWA